MNAVTSKLTEERLPAKAATFADFEAWLGLLGQLFDLIAKILGIFGGGSE